MKNEVVLVIGASGTVGKELVPLLKKQGATVRSATSKKTQLASDQVYIDLVSGQGINAAFEGVDRAFFLSPPGHINQHTLLSPLTQEAKRRGLKKVVLMTAMGANAVETSPMRQAELELEKSGLNYNIIRPNWFLQNFNTFWLQGILEQSKILLPAGKAKVSFIDSRDISAVAAKLLLSEGYDRKDFDLTGPEAVDHSQVAEALSKVSGRKIEYKEISPDELKRALTQGGLPSDYADFLNMIFGFLREGYNARLTSSVHDITGVKPRSLDQYAQDYKQIFSKT